MVSETHPVREFGHSALLELYDASIAPREGATEIIILPLSHPCSNMSIEKL